MLFSFDFYYEIVGRLNDSSDEFDSKIIALVSICLLRNESTHIVLRLPDQYIPSNIKIQANNGAPLNLSMHIKIHCMPIDNIQRIACYGNETAQYVTHKDMTQKRLELDAKQISRFLSLSPLYCVEMNNFKKSKNLYSTRTSFYSKEIKLVETISSIHGELCRLPTETSFSVSLYSFLLVLRERVAAYMSIYFTYVLFDIGKPLTLQILSSE